MRKRFTMIPLSYLLTILLSTTSAILAQSSGEPGYFTDFSTMPKNNSISFGRNYAVLNLDIINDLVQPVMNTSAGTTWLKCLETWNDAVHALNPTPLTVWTRIYYENAMYPDIKPGSPLARYLASSGIIVGPGPGNPNTTIQDSQLESNTPTAIYQTLMPKDGSDIVMQKTRFYAGFGNNLEHILAAQSIDTVVLSGIRTSGTIIATAINLISLNYNVYVISNNTIESPNPLGAAVAQSVDQSIKQGVLPNLPVQVITLEQAMAALNRSGPAIY